MVLTNPAALARAHDQQRRDLWAQAWVASAGSEGISEPEQASLWADAALRDFDKKFPAPVK